MRAMVRGSSVLSSERARSLRRCEAPSGFEGGREACCKLALAVQLWPRPIRDWSHIAKQEIVRCNGEYYYCILMG